MKAIAVLAILVACGEAAAADPQWEFVTSTKTFLIFIDRASVVTTNVDRRKAWLRTQYLQPRESQWGLVHESWALKVFNCRDRTSGILQVIEYAADRERLAEQKQIVLEDQMSDITPGTVASDELDAACQRSSGSGKK